MSKSELGRGVLRQRVRAGRGADLQSWIRRAREGRAPALPVADFATAAWRRQRTLYASAFAGVAP